MVEDDVDDSGPEGKPLDTDGDDSSKGSEPCIGTERDGLRLLPDSRMQRLLTILLLTVLVIASSGVVAVAVSPTDTSDPYTEFYILGSGGNASDYPTDLSPGESETVFAGISNHEHERITYRLVVKWNETTAVDRNVTVDANQTRELDLSVTAPEGAGIYPLQFRLSGGTVQDGDVQRLRLWTRVSEDSTE